MPSLLSVLYAALGGAIGSASRYLLGTWTQSISQSIDFPYGTLTVNLIGCFVIGFLSQLAESRGVFTPEIKSLGIHRDPWRLHNLFLLWQRYDQPPA